MYIFHIIYTTYIIWNIYAYIPKYIPYTLFKSQPIVNHRLDVEFETIKLSKNNRGEDLHDPKLVNKFSNMTTNSWSIRKQHSYFSYRSVQDNEKETPEIWGNIFRSHQTIDLCFRDYIKKKKTSKAEMATIFKLAKAFKICITKQNGKQRDVQNCKSLRKRLLEPDGDVAKRAKHTDSIMGWQVCGAIGMFTSWWWESKTAYPLEKRD